MGIVCGRIYPPPGRLPGTASEGPSVIRLTASEESSARVARGRAGPQVASKLRRPAARCRAARRPRNRSSRAFRPSPVARTVFIARAPADIFTGHRGQLRTGERRTHGACVRGHDRRAWRRCRCRLHRRGRSCSKRTGWAWPRAGSRASSSRTRSPTSSRWAVASGSSRSRRSVIALETVTGTERVIYGTAPTPPSRARPAEEIAPGLRRRGPPWARAGVEAARLAPSAMNRQPWRFRYEDGRVVVSFDGSDGAQGLEASGLRYRHAALRAGRARERRGG